VQSHKRALQLNFNMPTIVLKHCFTVSPPIMSTLLPYVMLIDDDPDDLEILSSCLELSGIRIKTFESAEKAVFHLALTSGIRDLPCLIILDYNLPRVNGQQTLVLIKSNKYTGHIPVVIYSTTISGVLKKALIELGALDCFVKPFSYAAFKAQVEVFKRLAVEKNIQLLLSTA
jgi:DNA-binding response OmpR family regulator